MAAIRAQPGAADPADEGRGVRQVVDDHDLTVANDRRGLLEPGPERLRHRQAHAVRHRDPRGDGIGLGRERGRRRDDDLDERSVRRIAGGADAHLVPRAARALHDPHGQVVEQLVREQHTVDAQRRQLRELRDDRPDTGHRLECVRGVGARRERAERLVGRLDRQPLALAGPQLGRALDQHVAQCRRAGRLGAQDVRRQAAPPGAGLDDDERVGRAEVAPAPVERACDERADTTIRLPGW